MNKKIWTALILTLVVGLASAYVSIGSNIEGGGNLEFYNVEVTPTTPDNSTVAESPMNFSCYIDCDGTFNSWMVNVTGADEATDYTYEETVTGAQAACKQYKYYKIDMASGNYNWTCSANKTFMDVMFSSPPSIRNNFTIFLRGINELDTLGACLSDKGWSMEFNADNTHDYVVFNMSGLGNWCKDTNCSNIWVEDAAEYKYTTTQDALIVDARTQKNFVLWIAGYNYDYNHTVDASTPDIVVNLTIANFTRENPSYWFDIRNEDDNKYFNYSLDSDELKMDIICEAYSPNTIDLKELNLTNFLVTTKEKPKFHGILNNNFNRVYRTYLSDENITLYFFNSSNQTSVWEIIDYELQDYTGEFYDSYFSIVRNVNTSLVTLYQDTWYDAEILNIALESTTEDAYVQYILYDPDTGNSRIIAWDHIVDGDRKYIVVREPQFTDQKNYIDGVDMGFTTSYDSSSVGVSYNVSVGTLDEMIFTVSNYSSDGGYQEMYKTTVVGTTAGSLTYIVPDNNATYWLTATLDTSEYDIIKIASLQTPAITEQRFPWYDSFGIPANVMGLTRDEIYTGASLFIITKITASFGAVGLGSGAVIVGAVIGMLKWFQWFREMTWELWGFIMIMCIAFYIVGKRRKIE